MGSEEEELAHFLQICYQCAEKQLQQQQPRSQRARVGQIVEHCSARGLSGSKQLVVAGLAMLPVPGGTQAAHPMATPMSWCPFLPMPEGTCSRPADAWRRGELGTKSPYASAALHGWECLFLANDAALWWRAVEDYSTTAHRVLGKLQLQGIIGLDPKPMEISAWHLMASGTSTYGNVMSYLLACLKKERQQRKIV